MERRIACPTCGSKSRIVVGGARLTAGKDVVVEAPTAQAQGGAPVPTLSLEQGLMDAGYSLQWLRLSEGGAWMLRVFGQDGSFIDGSIQGEPQDALLAVAERLLP